MCLSLGSYQDAVPSGISLMKVWGGGVAIRFLTPFNLGYPSGEVNLGLQLLGGHLGGSQDQDGLSLSLGDVWPSILDPCKVFLAQRAGEGFWGLISFWRALVRDHTLVIESAYSGFCSS